jgi:endoglucanase
MTSFVRMSIFAFVASCATALSAPDDFLKTDGKNIRNKAGGGDTVQLYGVNTGGWEIIETWMAPMTGAGNEWDARNLLAKRFGWDKAVALKKIYLNSWIKADDFSRIAAEKLNCIRVPVLWCDYMDTNGVWLTTVKGDTDFTLLDSVVVNARKQGLYTIIDLHGAPGSQNNKDHSGRENGILLFDSPKYRAILIDWWKGVARHFRGVAAVAGYDLINEPSETYPGTMGAKTVQLYDTLYKEIRRIDPDHMIFMEGIWTWDALPSPAAKQWTNVVYQFHWYYFNSTNVLGDNQNDVNNAVSHKNSWNVPSFVGEFNFNGNLATCVNRMMQNRIGWTMWTYKVTPGMGDWSMYVPSSNPGQKPDLANDSYDQIATKWNSWDTKNHFTRQASVCDVLKAAATMFGEPYRPIANPTPAISHAAATGRDAPRMIVRAGSNGSLTVSFDKAAPRTVSLMSINGRTVKRDRCSGAGWSIDTKEIAPGAYRIVAERDGAIAAATVVVAR